MKILILDDERYRHDTFDEKYAGHEVHHVYNVDQFKKALSKEGDFDLISFDHDLGEGEDGQAAARHLVEVRPADSVQFCVIHSWNSIGAKHIFNILIDAGFRAVVRRFRPHD